MNYSFSHHHDMIKIKSNISNNRAVGINQSSSTMQAEVYPNPAQNNLTLNFPANFKTSVTLRNLIGEEVFATEVSNDNTTKIDVSKFAPGVYLVEIVSSNGKFVQRIVKE